MLTHELWDFITLSTIFFLLSSCFFKKRWAYPGLFSFIFVLFSPQFKYKLKMRWFCVWRSNPGPQDGRRIRINWTMESSFLQFVCMWTNSIFWVICNRAASAKTTHTQNSDNLILLFAHTYLPNYFPHCSERYETVFEIRGFSVTRLGDISPLKHDAKKLWPFRKG